MSISRDIHDAVVNLHVEEGIQDPSYADIAEFLTRGENQKPFVFKAYEQEIARRLQQNYTLREIRGTLGKHALRVNARYYVLRDEGNEFADEHTAMTCIPGLAGNSGGPTVGIYIPENADDMFLRVYLQRTSGWGGGCLEHVLDTSTAAISKVGVRQGTVQAIMRKAARELEVDEPATAWALITGTNLQELNSAPVTASGRILRDLRLLYQDQEGIVFLADVARDLSSKNGKHFTPSKVAKVLAKFTIAPKTVYSNGHSGRGFEVATLRRAWEAQGV